MKQSSLDLRLSVRKAHKREFLAEMDAVVPWAALVELIDPYYPEGRNGRPSFALETMLRVHFMQQCFTLSDPAMEEAFFDVPLLPSLDLSHSTSPTTPVWRTFTPPTIFGEGCALRPCA